MATAKPAAKPATPPKDPAPSQASPSANVQELKVTAHMMALPAGLFCVVNEPAGNSQNGMPGVRLSPPPINGQDVEILGFRADGWLAATGDAALVRTRRPSQLLVSVYQLPNQPDSAPKIQVRQLLAGGGGVPITPAPNAAPNAPRERADLVAHIQTRGDVGVKFGDWIGEPGSGHWVEGFAIAAPDGIEPSEFSYQAVLGRGWLSPWVEAGQYCGSRGMALPLLGLRIRLSGKAAERYDIGYSASFVGGSTVGPVGNDETCEGEGLAPLEAIQVVLTPRIRKPLAKGKR